MRWRKKELAVLLAVLLAMPGMEALAEEPGLSGQNIFSTETEEIIESVSGDSMPQDVTASWPESQEEGQMLSDTPDGIIASGKDGNITWVIDGNGKLTVEGSGDFSRNHWQENFAWKIYSEQIISAELNVSDMTDGSWLFENCINMTSVDMSHFDTSNVTSMSSMFSGCSSLTNVDVSGFDTSNVRDMASMFSGCSSLTNVDVSGFDTSNVRGMGVMFSGCSSLTNLDVSGFDTSNVTDMKMMFNSCSSLTNLDVSGFDTSNVRDMGSMFSGCLTNVDVSGFDTSNVTDMKMMFNGCSRLTNLEVSGFDTSNVTSMGAMFSGCSWLTNLDVSGFDTSNVTYMGSMFSGCSSLTNVDVSGFDTSNVRDMGFMFSGCSSLTNLDVSGFDTGNVREMGWMFAGCSSLTNLEVSGFDTSNVTGMWEMFSGCSSLTNLDVSGFDTNNVRNMGYMFNGCSNLHILKTPYNVTVCVDLPDVSGTAWYLPDGTQVTQLPQNLNYSVTLTRTGETVTPTPSPAPTPVPTSAPAPVPTSAPTPVPTSAPAPVPTSAPAPTPTPAPVNPPAGDAAQKVQDFVSRMYTVALGRAAESQGLKDWTNRLLSHEFDGAGIADGFIMSDEFKNRHLSDGDYVDTLYRTFFNREADQGGRATWLGDLASGKSRGYVLAGFVNSREFDVLCDSYGIVRGVMREDGSPINPGIRGFVERCYTKVLGREGEKAGLEDWTNRIATGAMSAEDVARSFFFSEEYINKHTDNETFVETLYQTFMDRASDPAGKADWTGRLRGGVSRGEVLEGFSRSEEFTRILRSYGL